MPTDDDPNFLAVLRARHPQGTAALGIQFNDLFELDGLAAWVRAALAPTTPRRAQADDPDALKEEARTLEAQKIRRALEKARGNQSAAARALGMQRSTMVSKMKKYGIT